jgi:hypothetical protein
MNTKVNINQIITALMELEAKGCHSVYFEYGDELFRVKIFRGEQTVFEKQINLQEEQTGMDELLDLIKTLNDSVWTTCFQCYRQEFVQGKKAGKWEKIKSSFEVGKNSTYSMLIDGSGYYVDDPENGLAYFVDMKHASRL